MKYRKRVIPPKKVIYVFGRTILVATAQGTYICTMVHNGCPTFLNQTAMGLAEVTESITTIKYIENDKKNYSY